MKRYAFLLLAAGLDVLGLAPRAPAAPAQGDPLTVTTGTVYNVSTVAELQAALNAANAAGVPSTILLADHTYNLAGLVLALRCPGLIVRGASGNRDAVVLRGPDEGPSANQAHIFLVEANDVTIADLTLGYCRYHGIQIRGESPYDVAGTLVHNCRLVNCNEQFIKGSAGADPVGASDGIVENCLFEFTGGWAYQYYTGGIDIHRGVNWIVRDNLFRNIRNPTAQAGIAEHAVHFWNRAGEPQHIVVERNWIINCDRGIGFGLGSDSGGFTGGSSAIRNNMVANDGAGGHTDVGIGLEHASGVTVDNNTVYIPAYWAPMEYRFNTTSNILYRNNLVNSAIRLRDGAPPAAFSNNVESVQVAWFRDIPNGDLRLTPAATGAINWGCASSAQADLDGDSRPILGLWDVGADEAGPAWNGFCPSTNPAVFAEGKVPSREIHVAMTGSNATGDGSAGNPYATIQHAAGFATSGCAVVVAPGVYAGGSYVSGLSGTADHPIWIRGAYTTNRPVLNGGGEGLHLTRVRYLIVENLEVAGSANNGINCDDDGDYGNPEATRFVLFRNLYVHDIGSGGNQDGLKLSGVHDYAVADCTFLRGSADGSGIDHVGCHNGLIEDCAFTDMGSNAIQCKGGSACIVIRRCQFTRAGQRGINIGGSTGFAFFRPPLSTNEVNAEARSITVAANVFRDTAAPVAFVGCVDSVVAHNTFIDPADWFFRILQETVTTPPYTFAPAGYSGFVNNLVYFNKTRVRSTDINVGPNTAPGTFLIMNNLWYAHDNPGASAPDLPVPEIHGKVGVNPLLANPAAADYSITLASPAARSGASTGAADTDYTNAPYLSPPSIGAFELTGDLDGDGLPDAWEIRHFGGTNTTGGAASEDADGDRFIDYAEWVAGTDPTNRLSRLAIIRIERQPAGAVTLEWPSVADRMYTLYMATRLTNAPPWTVVADDLPAEPVTNQYLHNPDPAATRLYYRVGATR
jgi:hypothetical protein